MSDHPSLPEWILRKMDDAENAAFLRLIDAVDDLSTAYVLRLLRQGRVDLVVAWASLGMQGWGHHTRFTHPGERAGWQSEAIRAQGLRRARARVEDLSARGDAPDPWIKAHDDTAPLGGWIVDDVQLLAARERLALEADGLRFDEEPSPDEG